MSYSRSYRTDIKLRGTVKASFPASENGGTQTIEWQHIEPINIYVDVDTNPFDFSVTQCDERIDMLKAAVLSMNTAQVLSIKKVSQDVAKHVTDGFFDMVSSEISQQIADLLNKVNAKLSLMIEQDKAVVNMLEVMKRDYARLSSHYHDLFVNLDTELERRIHTLDKQSFNLSIEVMDKLLLESTLNAGSTQIIESSDMSSLQTLIAASAIKSKVNNLIEIAKQYLADDKKLSMSLVDIVDDLKIDRTTNVYLPLLIIGKNKISENEHKIDFIMPDNTPEAMKSELMKQVPEKIIDLNWSDIKPEEREKISEEYENLVNNEFSSKIGEQYARQRELMMKFIKGNIQSIYEK